MAFEKGQSGNPGGRPKEKPFRDALRRELAAIGEDDPKALRGLARNLLRIAAGDDGLQAIKEVADRLDGRPSQAIEATHDVTEGFAELMKLVDGKTRGLPSERDPG